MSGKWKLPLQLNIHSVSYFIGNLMKFWGVFGTTGKCKKTLGTTLYFTDSFLPQ